MKPIRSGNRAISVQTRGEPLAIVATTTQSPMAMMPTEISSESTLSMVAILPVFCRPAFKDDRGDLAVGSTDQKVKILFAPLKFSLSPMRCLARRVELFHPMPIDRLHHSYPRKDHRAVVLRGLRHHA